MSFPGALYSAHNSSSNETLANQASIGHAALHNLVELELVAVETKIGTGASTPAANTVLRGTGTGTSGWGQVDLSGDVTGILPVGSGGIGQNSLSNLTLPAANLPSTPTLSTPNIGDFTNATHDHESNAGGGTLGTGALESNSVTTDKIADGAVTSEKLSATVAFGASAAGTITSGSQQVIDGWTEDYDIGSDFNNATGIFTAPYDGIYHFDGGIQITNTNGRVILWLNVGTPGAGSRYRSEKQTSSAAADISTEISMTIQLTAGDTVDLEGFQETGSTVAPGNSYFSGFFIGA